VTAARESKPSEGEFLPYYGRYIALVPAGDVLATLEAQMGDTQALLRGLPASTATYRYAPDKWTVNEVIGHVIDADRTTTCGIRTPMLIRSPSWRRSSIRSAGQLYSCSSTWMNQRGCVGESQATRKLPSELWLTSSRGTSCTTARFSTPDTSRELVAQSSRRCT